MTCREKLKLNHPELVDDIYAGGCADCPPTYNYLDKPDYCGLCDNDCYLCWNREIPEEPKREEKSKMTCRNKFHFDHAEMDSEDAVNLRRKSCPHDFGYAEEPDYCTGNRLEDHCFTCWERQISEKPKEEKKLIYAHTEFAGENNQNVSAPVIKDSGNRREFESGAVRDMQEGKGRCDLMPLEVVAEYFRLGQYAPDHKRSEDYYWILWNIANFKNSDYTKTSYLYSAMGVFSSRFYEYEPTMFLEVAKHFEAGAKKYSEDNWKRGIPPKCYIDSAVRHFLKCCRGDEDEPHANAFIWNLMCCIWEVDYHVKENENA